MSIDPFPTLIHPCQPSFKLECCVVQSFAGDHSKRGEHYVGRLYPATAIDVRYRTSIYSKILAEHSKNSECVSIFDQSKSWIYDIFFGGVLRGGTRGAGPDRPSVSAPGAFGATRRFILKCEPQPDSSGREIGPNFGPAKMFVFRN
jgi:hypothetical protein